MTPLLQKRLYLAGIIGYILLLALAVLFYKERSFFVDISYHLFFITKDSSFAIQNFRFGAVVTQIFPLLAVKAGLSLGATAFIYSIGFIIYYFACYIICGTVLKQYNYAFIILLFNTLIVSDTFYWIQSELPQGLVFMVTMFAVMAKERAKTKPVIYVIICFMALTVAFFHPLIIFPFSFIILFLLSRKGGKPTNGLLYAAGFFFLLSVLLKKILFSTSYDKAAMLGLDNFSTRFPYIRLYANKHFAIYSLTHFYWLTILSIVTVVFYISQKNWKKAILFVSFFAGYLLLINVSFPNRDTTAFYIENLYLPLTIFVALPFVFDVLPYMAVKNCALPALSLIIITAGIRIYFSHSPYTTRLNWERNFLAQNGGDKLVIDGGKIPADTLMMTWGTPYEFWLLSTVETGKTASIVINDNAVQLAWALNKKRGFITTWGVYEYTDLPVKYFHFTDTTSVYKMIR